MAYISKISKFVSNRALLQCEKMILVKNYQQNHNLAFQTNEAKSTTYENAFKDILMLYNQSREQPDKMNSFGKILVVRELLKRMNVTDDDLKKMNIIHVTGKDLVKQFVTFITLRFR